MKKFLALLLVLVPLCLSAQTVHTFGALDTQNFWTGNNSYLRLIPPHGPVIGEPPLPLLWTVYVVTDGASGSDCTVGGGTDQHWCGWTGVAWVPLGGTGGGGGGATPCGAANDVQTTDGAGNFTCDTGIFEEFANTHTLDVWIGNFAQQVQISDPAHTGKMCLGHSNGSVVDANFCLSLGSSFSTTNSGYGVNIPNSPSINKPLCITSLTPDGNGLLPSDWCATATGAVSAENIPAHFSSNSPAPATTTDVTFTSYVQQQNTVDAGPLNPADPASAMVQVTNPANCVTAPTAATPCVLASPVSVGNTLYVVDYTQCGLGCSGVTYAYTSALGNVCTQIDYSDGSGASIPYITYRCPVTVDGIETITITPTLTGGDGTYNNQSQVYELRGTATTNANVSITSSTAPTLTFGAITTTGAPTVIIATSFLNDSAAAYTPGSGWFMNQSMQGGLAPFASMASEIQNQAGTGTFTPAMTASGTGGGGTISTAFVIALSGSAAKPFFRWLRYQDLRAGGDFPSSSGQSGKCLAATGTVGILQFINCLASGSAAFSALTSGTNTAAAMLVGTGASLGPTGSGTVNANQVNGASVGTSLGIAGTNSSGQIVAATVTHVCEIVWGGSGSGFALTSGDDAVANQACLNILGVTETITAVQCRSDAGSNTTTVNPTFGTTGAGTTICSGALTCGSSGAYSSSCSVSNSALTTGTNINPIMGGTLTGTSIHLVVTATATK